MKKTILLGLVFLLLVSSLVMAPTDTSLVMRAEAAAADPEPEVIPVVEDEPISGLDWTCDGAQCCLVGDSGICFDSNAPVGIYVGIDAISQAEEPIVVVEPSTPVPTPTPSPTPTVIPSTSFSCLQSQQCKNVDDIWIKIRDLLIDTIKDKVWHGSWMAYELAHPAPVSTTTPPGINAYGLLFQTQGVVSQYADASPELLALLTCMRSKLPSNAGQISSISDSAGLATCRDSWSDPVCHHGQTSSHYGCSGQSQQSLGVDYGDEENTCQIISAAVSCGITDKRHIIGPANNGPWGSCNTQYVPKSDHNDHVHISVQSARCY